jgi:hypothetical protein
MVDIDGYAARCGMQVFEHLTELRAKVNAIRSRSSDDIVGLEWQVWEARRLTNQISRELSAMFSALQEASDKKKPPKITAVS